MFDNSTNNKRCGKGDELVSYLYEELRDAQKESFEGHLSECDACSEDLASFSSVRMMLDDVRPEYASQPIPTTRAVETPAAGSWFGERLNGLFGVRGLAAGATAAAVLAIVLFGAWFLFFGTESAPVAESGPGPGPIETDNVLPVDQHSENIEGGSELVSSGSILSEDEDGSVSARKVRRVTTKRKKAPARMPDTQLADFETVPTLSEAAGEDLDDESLRLTDLLSDVSDD